MTRSDDLLTHPWLTFLLRVVLGAIFVTAAVPKILDPPSFAHMIHNYRLVPGPWVNLLALVLPWVELVCGLALIFGFWRRTAALITGALLIAFIGAIATNVIRVHPIDCGCFDVTSAGKTPPEQILDMLWAIVRDVAMLAMVVQILLGTGPPAMSAPEAK